MKVGITADVHLTAQKPERVSALKNIFQTLQREGIGHLIIAGDLFDLSGKDYHLFDELCREYENIKVFVIPGNHDSELRKQNLTGSNVKVFEKPQMEKIENVPFLFVPYNSDSPTGLDGILFDFFSNNVVPDKWILISHSDYYAGDIKPNEYEGGRFYMPLSRSTVNTFKPEKVILGHIHKGQETGKVIYPGSPCGIDVSETGKRRFIVLDLKTLEWEKKEVDTEVIFFDETILVTPLEPEPEIFAEKSIKKLIERWEVNSEDLEKIKLRLKLRGFYENREGLEKAFREKLKERGISLYEEEMDMKEVKVSSGVIDEKLAIIERSFDIAKGLSFDNNYVNRDLVKEKIVEIVINEKFD